MSEAESSSVEVLVAAIAVGLVPAGAAAAQGGLPALLDSEDDRGDPRVLT